MPRQPLSETEDTVTITFCVNRSMFDAIATEARRRHNGNLSAAVREAIRLYIASQPTRRQK